MQLGHMTLKAVYITKTVQGLLSLLKLVPTSTMLARIAIHKHLLGAQLCCRSIARKHLFIYVVALHITGI